MLSWETIVALFSLTLMEVALGIDNLVFISVVSEKLPAKSQPRARRFGITGCNDFQNSFAFCPGLFFASCFSFVFYW